MAKNSKRRRNGKLKKNVHLQYIDINYTTKVTITERSKTIKKKDTVNLPLRKDYTFDTNGKYLFKKARKLFWESHKYITKVITIKRKISKRLPSDELLKLQSSPSRDNDISTLRNIKAVQKGNAAKGNGRCITFVNKSNDTVRNKPTVITSIEFEKTLRKTRFNNHHSKKITNLQKRLKAA